MYSDLLDMLVCEIGYLSNIGRPLVHLPLHSALPRDLGSVEEVVVEAVDFAGLVGFH